MAQRPPRSRPLVASLVILWACVGCATWTSPFETASDGTFVHRKRGYRIGTPQALEGGVWRRMSVDGTVIGFRHVGAARGEGADGATLSMLVDCGEFEPQAQLEARNLRLGLDGVRTVFSGPTVHRGFAGWAQAFDAQSAEETVRIEAVTVVVGVCTFDWVLVTRRPSRTLEDVFRAWWTGFVPGPVVQRKGAPAERPR